MARRSVVSGGPLREDARVSIRVVAHLRQATPAEVTEGLERNPGSARLAEQGWTPAWFEVEVAVEGEQVAEHSFSLVWRRPGATAQELAEDELDFALEEALRNLRDLEGVDVEREDIPADAIELRVDPALS